MGQFIYDLMQSPYFGILLLIWIFIDVLWIGRWKDLFKRIAKLISKPWIFAKDPSPNDTPMYPRESLEQLAQRDRDSSAGGKHDNQGGPFRQFINAQSSLVFDPAHPLRTIGYIFFLAFFVFFLIADAISVAQTLQVMGLIQGELPELFQRFDLAVLGGALLSAVVGVWIFAEALGESEFIDTGRLNEAQKGFLKILSLIVAFNSIIVMIAFAMNRLIAVGNLTSNPTLDIILNAILFGLVPINSALAAAMCFPAATRGVLVILYLIGFIIIGVLPVLAFLIDIIWRFAYIVLDILIWALFTPFVLIPVAIGKLLELLAPKKK